jgi:aminopeptidase N
MFLRLLSLVPLIALAALPAVAAPPEGIPRDLARQRAARVSDLRYRLSFALVPGAPSAAGTEELSFTLHDISQPLLLDFRDGTLVALSVNGAASSGKIENGHIELPAVTLRQGENKVSAKFTTPIAAAGKPFTRFTDREDHTEYIYTLFVPMDASMAFPCFDQPDLKARFTLEIDAPQTWTVISNTEINQAAATAAGTRRTAFHETLPISTYLLAFAAGPFRKLPTPAGVPGLYVRQSKLAQAQAEAPEVQQIAAQGTKYLATYFAHPFPFPKYDMVLIPGFPYGGMEHAGATFLREESVLFRAAPTRSDLLNRDILVLHELTHQWFGDLVTMRWFDDLWLKEGFAQYMAFQALASLKPDDNIWKRFYEQIKPAAYEIDSTQGSTPIYQDIANLADAKSAYGAIVYSKAPGVLKQLAFVLGDDKFRDGLRLYLSEHAYANAEWSDLVGAFQRVSGRSLSHWAEMWIRHRGMPQVDVAWSCDGGHIAALSLSQRDVLGTADLWPIATQLLLDYGPGQPPVTLRADLDGKTKTIAEAAGKPCPRFIFVNDQDYAYGRFLLDAHSREDAMAQLGAMPDLFRRTLLLGSLWDSVRQADLAPRSYIALAAQLLPREQDETLTQSLLSHLITSLHRYVPDEARNSLVAALETMAADRMANASDANLRIVWFRGLRALAETPAGLAKLKDLLSGKLAVSGVELRPLDRWNLITALIAHSDPQADQLLAAEQMRDTSGDGPKYAYIAEAARPGEQTKRKYFDDYLHNPARPEDWIEDSLSAFNYWNQSALTAPYLKASLEALGQIKRDRKIFFLVDWLDAFLDGQHSAAAQTQVHEYLQTAAMDADLRLKILQSVDALDRTVAIRAKFPQ